MKTLSIIPLLLLSACSTPNAPTLTIRPQEPSFPIDAPGIRYPEFIGAYHLGRYVDPSNALHEQHTVYRVEAGGRWDFHPGPREAEVGPPPFERDAAFSVPPATDEIIAELNRQKEVTQTVTAESNKLTDSIQQFGRALVDLRASVQQNRQLREQLADAMKRIEALEGELKKQQMIPAPVEPDLKNETVQ